MAVRPWLVTVQRAVALVVWPGGAVMLLGFRLGLVLGFHICLGSSLLLHEYVVLASCSEDGRFIMECLFNFVTLPDFGLNQKIKVAIVLQRLHSVALAEEPRIIAQSQARALVADFREVLGYALPQLIRQLRLS